MTKSIFIVIVSMMLAVVWAASTYNMRYDNFDVDSLLANDRILTSYVNCMLDKGPCTPEGKEFKQTIPEALATSCGKCTAKQKEIIRKVIKALQERHLDKWNLLEAKYDTRKYRSQIESFLNSDS